MKFDLEGHLGRVDRSVGAIEYEGKPARAVRLERSYSTSVDDLWDALTNPERLPRWFLPVTGDLRPGGRYQLQGNAEGTITRCEPPRLLFVTWEFGGGMSWVDVQLSAEGDADSRLSLTHIVPVDEHWQKYGAGATGVGWDLGLVEQQPDVRTVVLVSGDRDYVPLVQALQRRGREVVMVSFREHLSARLFDNVEAGLFMDAEELMTDEARALLQEDHHANGQPEETTEFAEVAECPYPIDYEALRVIEEYFGQYDEVYLTPLLRKLSEELGDIEDHDPKSLIGDLEDCGACRLERRKGMPYDYTVLIVNREHPAVIEVQDEMNGDYDDEDDENGYAEDEDDFVPAEEE